MPVFVEALGGRPLWTKKQHSLAHGAGVQAIRIALVNNMPDAALEDTELQFFDLLLPGGQRRGGSIRFLTIPGTLRFQLFVLRKTQFLRRPVQEVCGQDEATGKEYGRHTNEHGKDSVHERWARKHPPRHCGRQAEGERSENHEPGFRANEIDPGVATGGAP